DITAHVNFTAIRLAGEEEGLTTVEETLQAEWLRALGIADWGAGTEVWPEESALDDLGALIDPERLGRLRVLIQQRL
ncbi:MAG: SAM-dependent methyltransferase, partial [Armatimonadota bacterium]|nr:SAM-dependent methyltransferase [Armatimonadota bacterium]